MLLDDSQESNDNLGRRSNQNLSLTSLLGVGNSLKGVSESRSSGHFGLSESG